jgi:hypothetical protein
MSQITVGTTAVQAAPRNAKRLGITLYNKSTGGQVIDLSKYGPSGLTTGNSEYSIAVGSGLTFLLAFDGPEIRGEWGAISSAAGGTLVVGETAQLDGV